VLRAAGAQLWKYWMAFSHAIGMVMSWVILSVFWVVGIGIYALILQFVRLCTSTSARNAIWENPQPEYPESIRHQF